MKLRAAFASGAWLVAVTASCAADLRAPFDVVRELIKVQDDIFGSEKLSVAKHDALTSEFERSAASNTSVWTDPRNRRALVVFLLRGGSTRAGFEHSTAVADAGERALLEAALAFGDGRDKDALELLKKIELRRLPTTVSGPVALTIARLIGKSDLIEATRALDLARLFAPGTLVEEVALRMQIEMASDAGDSDKFATFSRRYVTRFGRSVYFGEFLEMFESYYSRAWVAADDGRRQALEGSLSSFPANVRSELTLALAREALLAGDMEACRGVIKKTLSKGDASGPLAIRAKLYESAADIFSDRRGAAAQNLAGLDRAQLSPVDRAIRDGALALVEQIQKPIASASATPEKFDWPAMRKIEESLAAATSTSERAK